MPANLFKRMDYVRATWGLDIYVRVGAILSGNDALAMGGIGAFYDPSLEPLLPAIEKKRADRIDREMRRRGELRGEEYIPWLGREVKKICRPAERAAKAWSKGGRPTSGPLASRLHETMTEADANLHALSRGSFGDVDSWATIRDWMIAVRPDVSKIGLLEATRLSRDWHAEMEQIAKEKAGRGETGTTVYEHPSGLSVRQLNTKIELEEEGEMMGHCVGGYHSDVQRGRSVIYSLRDAKNRPHATIEVSLSPSYPVTSPTQKTPVDLWGVILQCKGKGNRDVAKKYRPALSDWLKSTGFKGNYGEAIHVFNAEEKRAIFADREEEIAGDVRRLLEALDSVTFAYVVDNVDGTPLSLGIVSDGVSMQNVIDHVDRYDSWPDEETREALYDAAMDAADSASELYIAMSAVHSVLDSRISETAEHWIGDLYIAFEGLWDHLPEGHHDDDLRSRIEGLQADIVDLELEE